MNDLFLEAVRLINPLQVILIGLIIFFFYNRLDTKIEGVKQEIKENRQEFKQEIKDIRQEFKQEIKTVHQRLDSLYQLIANVFMKEAA